MKSSSSWSSVGIGVVIGENSSSDPREFLSSGGVIGIIPFLALPLLHFLTVLEPSLWVMFGVLGACGLVVPFVFGNELFVGANKLLSSPVTKDPSRAPVDSVGARPESLFDGSCPSTLLTGLLNAGCVSVGGRRGGAMVTGIGCLACRVSS